MTQTIEPDVRPRRRGPWRWARRRARRLVRVARRVVRRMLDASAGSTGDAGQAVRFSPGPRRAPILAFAPYVAVSAVHLAALLAGYAPLGHVTKPLLMPTLALALVVLTGGARQGWVRGTLAALLFGWLGDVTLDQPGRVWFLIGLGCFLAGHLAYVRVFWPRDRISGFLRRPWPALPYVAWLIAMIVVLAPRLGAFVIVLAGYGFALGTMAALALGVNRTTAIGAAIFLVSDSLLALTAFVPSLRFPGADATVMLAYLLGQGLIVLGLVRASRGTVHPAPGVRPTAGGVVG